MEPSQDETKVNRQEQDQTETKVEGSLPPLKGLSFFEETITARELALLRAFNELDTPNLLMQLREIGVSGNEVSRRTGISQSNISKATRGEISLSRDFDAKIRRVALDEINRLQSEAGPLGPTDENVQSQRKAELIDQDPLLLWEIATIDSAEILARLKARGVSNKEVARRLGHSNSSAISRIANRKRVPGEDLRLEILHIALKESAFGK